MLTDAFRPQSSDSFASVSQIIMAEHMQINYDLCLYHSFEMKAVEFDTVKKNCEMKVITDLQPLHRRKFGIHFEVESM